MNWKKKNPLTSGFFSPHLQLVRIQRPLGSLAEMLLPLWRGLISISLIRPTIWIIQGDYKPSLSRVCLYYMVVWMRCPLCSHALDHLVPCWWGYLGKLRGLGFAEGSRALGQAWNFPVCSLLPICGSRCELSVAALAPCLPFPHRDIMVSYLSRIISSNQSSLGNSVLSGKQKNTREGRPHEPFTLVSFVTLKSAFF